MVRLGLRRFAKSENGSVAIMFGFMLIILALFSGLAIDLSRVYSTSSFVSAAIDSTALAVARELQTRDMDNDEVERFAALRFDALVNGNRKAATGIEFDDLDVSVNRGDETVTVTAASVV
ncbi:MAG: TadE/TadG family type IV pilus assembly protein, partial [Pseudomonadota bacterium]